MASDHDHAGRSAIGGAYRRGSRRRGHRLGINAHHRETGNQPHAQHRRHPAGWSLKDLHPVFIANLPHGGFQRTEIVGAITRNRGIHHEGRRTAFGPVAGGQHRLEYTVRIQACQLGRTQHHPDMRTHLVRRHGLSNRARNLFHSRGQSGYPPYTDHR